MRKTVEASVILAASVAITILAVARIVPLHALGSRPDPAAAGSVRPAVFDAGLGARAVPATQAPACPFLAGRAALAASGCPYLRAVAASPCPYGGGAGACPRPNRAVEPETPRAPSGACPRGQEARPPAAPVVRPGPLQLASASAPAADGQLGS